MDEYPYVSSHVMPSLTDVGNEAAFHLGPCVSSDIPDGFVAGRQREGDSLRGPWLQGYLVKALELLGGLPSGRWEAQVQLGNLCANNRTRVLEFNRDRGARDLKVGVGEVGVAEAMPKGERWLNVVVIVPTASNNSQHVTLLTM